MSLKYFFALALALPLTSQAVFFNDRDYSNDCAGYVSVDDGYALNCKDAADYSEVKRAKVGENTNLPKKVGAKTKDGFELGVVVDADTDMIYLYNRELLSAKSKVVGYVQISAYRNSETMTGVQLNARYNKDGELVSARAYVLEEGKVD